MFSSGRDLYFMAGSPLSELFSSSPSEAKNILAQRAKILPSEEFLGEEMVGHMWRSGKQIGFG